MGSAKAGARAAAPKGDARGGGLDRPFDPATWREAALLATQYQLLISFEDGEYFGRTVELPLVMSDGRTIEQCAKATLEATTVAIATFLERGERPPSPASGMRREVQLNIRLTADEKLKIDAAARQAGFRSIADFVRTAALARSA